MATGVGLAQSTHFKFQISIFLKQTI